MVDELTQQERIVLALMAEGCSNQGIAERLVVSPRTVETHVARIFRKMNLWPCEDDHRRVRAVLTYLASSSNARRPASSSTCTPRRSAFSSFEPGDSPATR
jgi:DNA-binding NarL/FixJ family response regulator